MVRFYALWIGTLIQFCQATIYTNDWAVRITADPESVDRIAEKYGFTNMGQIGDLETYYRFRHKETPTRSTVSNNEVAVAVAKETKVEWLQQQAVLRRVKRNSEANHIYSTDVNTKHLTTAPVQSSSSQTLHFNDSMWNSLWYIHCSSESKGCPSPMNIAAAWSRGYTGKGVVVSVLDDGIESEHPDLKPNYDPLASYDVNGQDQDPSPNYSKNASNYHGTQCAGMIAAAANNSRCTVGVSFHSRIGGIRMLDGDVTDAVEAQSLSFRSQYIDIYSSSWGPEDDGATLEGPGPLARLALEHGIKTGRRGRGSVFVWASGNGGQRGDHCSCDGYSSSIYTISISGSTQSGNPPEHLEKCPSTLATAYTGRDYTDKMVTLGPGQSCSQTTAQTSLSSSMAAGVIALTLEANPSLTWRDVQHIIVGTANARQLIAPDWQVNGAGYKVSHLYGFGLLDAESMVTEAKTWKTVPPQRTCVEKGPVDQNGSIPLGSTLTIQMKSSGCSGDNVKQVTKLEHVVLTVSFHHRRRGDVSIDLFSPLGTKSEMLSTRRYDDSDEGLHDWTFMTVHNWGESPRGVWTLNIQDTPSQPSSNSEPGVLKDWSLEFYGIKDEPAPERRRWARSADMPTDSELTEEYNGPCDPECSDDGCEGPGPRQCVTCLHFFLKFKNSTRICVSECPRGFWGDRRRCKRCYSSCETCTGSRSNQCTSCQAGHHLTEGSNSCTAICGDNYYLDHDANMCRKCSENCLKCTSYSICTECKPDTSLQGNRCQQSCAAGLYHDEVEGACRPCHKACATCAGAGVEACERCAEGFLMEEWKCVVSCGAGFYATQTNPETADGHGTCRRCAASCLTCAGPSQANCSSCSSGHRLQEGECVVDTQCTDGEYQDAEGKCHACDATCLKCTGPQRGDCISCASSRALDDGRCVSECAKGKYRSGGRCHRCDHTCATCVDAGPANCTGCDTDKFGVERYLYKGQCVDACPEAFYHTKERSCLPCSQNCHLCTGPAHCLKCNTSFYVSDGACAKLECGEGEVEDPDYNDCMACEEGCRKCVLYNPKHCLSCTEGFYNFQDGCYKNCPAKTYGVEEEMTCVPCDDNCVSCDEHECYWCETDLFLSEGSCVSGCPGGFYGDEDTNDCEECHPECGTCGGPERDDCQSCEEGRTLELGECVSDHKVCPIKTFRSDDGECEECHPSCESCSGDDKNQCTKCAKGRFLTTQQTCVSKCPGGFYGGGLSGQCEACATGCLQCADAQHCTRCQSTRKTPYFLQEGKCVQECERGYPLGQVCRSCAAGCSSCAKNATHCLGCDHPLLLHRHQCVEECPPAHTVRDGECQRCPSACLECNALGQCTGCEEYHFLLEGLCVSDCPERFFEDKGRRECLRCHPDCALCDGHNSNDCDACTDAEATLHNGACLAPCPSHAYRDALTAECKDCDATCLSCQGPGSCSSCREGHRLEGHGRCVPANRCSPRQYADRHGDCHACHKYCHRCSGPGNTHCLSCNQRHLLLNGTCMEACPAGYYEDESGQRCEPCHPSCESCVGQLSHECLACKSHLFREGKECVETCQHSHYGNAGSGTCEKCDPSCGECVGAEEDSCLSCAPGLVYLRRDGRCLPSCPQRYYHDAARRTCEPCHASCRACSGNDPQSCDSCYPGYLLSHGVCESLCDVGQYPLLKDSGHACEDCDGSCLECGGPGPANCTVCPTQAILEAGGRCLLCCHHDQEEEEEEEEEASTQQQQDCCNCTETRGECVLSTNVAFRNVETKEEEETRGNLSLFVVACVLLALGLVAVAFLVRHSRSKSAPPDVAPRGYEKLGGPGRHSGGGGGGGYSSASSTSRFNNEPQLVDVSGHKGKGKGIRADDEDDDDDDDDEDIVYMGQDGTVYRKFRYGQLGDDNDDELEYDDESYTFR